LISDKALTFSICSKEQATIFLALTLTLRAGQTPAATDAG
jgi:hypothetical protein